MIEKTIKPIPVANIIALTTENRTGLCANEAYIFEAEDAGNFANYHWSFGKYANQLIDN